MPFGKVFDVLYDREDPMAYEGKMDQNDYDEFWRAHRAGELELKPDRPFATERQESVSGPSNEWYTLNPQQQEHYKQQYLKLKREKEIKQMDAASPNAALQGLAAELTRNDAAFDALENFIPQEVKDQWAVGGGESGGLAGDMRKFDGNY